MKSPEYIYVTLPRPLPAGAAREYRTLRLRVSHRHAGINIAGNPYQAGHVLSLTPCTIGNGFMESTLLGSDQWTSGFLIPLDDRPRKNPHYIARAQRAVDELKEHIAEAFSERDGTRLVGLSSLMHAAGARTSGSKETLTHVRHARDTQ
jgi:hypothetical protein